MEPMVRPSGWQGQAGRLVTTHAGVGTKITVAARQSARRTLSGLEAVAAGAPGGMREAISPTSELELERELEAARWRIARLERRLAREAATNHALNEQAGTSAAAAEHACARASNLADEINAMRNSQRQPDLAAPDDRAEFAAQKDAALKDASGRIQFLEAALGAAERECARRDDEVARVNEKLRNETGAFRQQIESMSARLASTEQLLMDVQHYLLAHSAKSNAAEKANDATIIDREAEKEIVVDREVETEIAEREVDKENEQLSALLRLTLLKVEQLERSRAALLVGTQSLLQALGSCDATHVLEQEAVRLVDRQADRFPETQANDNKAKNAERAPQTRNSAKERADWVELAQLLTQLIRRKRPSSERAPQWNAAVG